MCSELKPCPVEKPGEKHHIEAIETRPGYGYIYCFDCEFAFPGEEELSADVLADRWNTRAERTCAYKWSKFGDPDDPQGCYEAWHCSNCGEIDDDLEEPPIYCLICGAKVVE